MTEKKEQTTGGSRESIAEEDKFAGNLKSEDIGTSSKQHTKDEAMSSESPQMKRRRSKRIASAPPKSPGGIESKLKQTEQTNDPDNAKLLEESKQLLKIFPEEIWLMIFDMIPKPSDLQQISNSSPFFRDLLLPKRVLFLFPKVWEILSVKYHHQNKKLLLKRTPPPFPPPPPKKSTQSDPKDVDSPETKENSCAECGRQRLNHWCSGLLVFRSVCREWSTAFDNYYDSLSTIYSDNLEDSYAFLENDFYLWTDDDQDNNNNNNNLSLRPSQAVQHFDRSHGESESPSRNPFVGRRIYIDWTDGDSEEDENAVIIGGMFGLLELYGHHFWYCDFRIPDDVSIDAYAKIREYLELLPGLKTLRIIWEQPSDQDQLDHEELQELKEEAIRKPLPMLENLRALRTENVHSVVFNQLIRRNSEVLRSLKIEKERSDSKLHGRYDLFKVRLPNLRTLGIYFYSKEDFLKLSCPIVKSPLEKLDLDFDMKLFIEWPKIFRLLGKKWQKTLTELKITLPQKWETYLKLEIMTDCASYRLKLPKLKKLKVTLRNPTSLDFILPTKESLEYLEIDSMDYEGHLSSNRFYRAVRDEQIIDYVGFTRRMLESNIWVKFEKLEVIVLNIGRGSKYSRREWKRWLEKGNGK